MAIVKLSKITLYGCLSQRDQVLRGLQSIGCVHLVDLHGKSKPEQLEDAARTEVHAAIKHLSACRDQRPSSPHDKAYDRERIARRALLNKRAHDDLDDEREKLLREIAATAPWGDFHMPPPESLGGMKLWLYKIRHRDLDQLEGSEFPWQIVSTSSRFAYVALIGKEQPVGVTGRLVALDHRSRSELQARLEEVDHTLERLDLERISLTRWLSRLTADLEAADDDRRLAVAGDHLLNDGPIFALRGWAPEKTISAIEAFAREYRLACTIETPGATDSPPTLLTNPQAVSGAEGAVTFYMTPSYSAWDPTWLMYVSFSLFFAMIMADAGYGIVLAIVLAVMTQRLRATQGGRRIYGLLVAIVALTIGYGVLIGSYFGAAPPVGGWLDWLVWKHKGASIMNDQSSMMLLAASIGVIHLSIANLISAWNRRGASRALGYVGWAGALVGGLVMAIAKLTSPPLVNWIALRIRSDASELATLFWQSGTTLLTVGLVMVFCFSSDRSLFSSKSKDWLWRPLEGLMGLTNISKAFGDSLSYLRLFALGLASAQLAVTFNGLAAGAMEISGVGILLGSLIFLVGHTLNLALGVVGGVVHGLRLNCIEFFSWSLTDEGYPFRAFCKKADR
jgi:V/A-type H+-transporting ATPase subunit I